MREFALTQFILLTFALGTFGLNNVCPTWLDYWATPLNPRCSFNNDVDLTLPEISSKYGYPVETHSVTTQDGYILQIFRIKNEGGKPVLVVHGIFASAWVWFAQGNNSLAFVLARQGYDVWAVNLRGTAYSSGHVNSAISAEVYWRFSVHEMGTKDFPATVEYVYAQTNQQKLVVVSFSMGSTAALIYTSTFPEDAEKYLERGVAMAPVAALKGSTSILRRFEFLWTPIEFMLQFSGSYSVLGPGNNGLMQRILFLATPLHMDFYRFVMGLVFGLGGGRFNPWALPIIVLRGGDRIDVHIINHYRQIMHDDKFRALDYKSAALNVAHYGNEAVPEYDLGNITVPLTFIYAENDALADPKDVRDTFGKLPSSTSNCLQKVNNGNFNHQDFVVAHDVYELLYKLLAEKWIQGGC